MKELLFTLQSILFRWNRHMGEFRKGPGRIWFHRAVVLSFLYFALLIWYLRFPESERTGRYLSVLNEFVFPVLITITGLYLMVGLIYLGLYLLERYSPLDRDTLFRYGIHEAGHLALWAPAIRVTGGFGSPFLTNVNFSIQIEEYGASTNVDKLDALRSVMGDLYFMDILLAGHVAETLFLNEHDLGSYKDMISWEQYAKRWLSLQKYSVPYFACPMCDAEVIANAKALKNLYDDSVRRVKGILECNQDLIEETAKRFVRKRHLSNEECRGTLARFRIPLESSI